MENDIKKDLALWPAAVSSFKHQKSEGIGKKQYFFVPDEIDTLIEIFQEKYEDAFKVRRGKWKDGFSRLNKEEVLWIIILDGLGKLEDRIDLLDKYLETESVEQ